MSGDIHGIFGGDDGTDYSDLGHQELCHPDLGHYDTEPHEPQGADVPLFAAGALPPSVHQVDSETHFAPHPLEHHGDSNRPYDSPPDTQVYREVSDLRAWNDIGIAHHDLHILKHSDAEDSNNDGISDAASRDMGIDPDAVRAHHTLELDYVDRLGHLHHADGKDSDGDGYVDDLERLVGTDPYDAASHPSIVEAHHFPAGSDKNLPGTIDVVPLDHLWRLP